MGQSGVTVKLTKPLHVLSGSATISAVHHANAKVYLIDDAGTKVGEFHLAPKGKTQVDNTITLKSGKQFPITVASYTIQAWWNAATLRAISFKCIGPS